MKKGSPSRSPFKELHCFIKIATALSNIEPHERITLFIQKGKNKHDYACASLAMLVEFLDTRGRGATVMKRPF